MNEIFLVDMDKLQPQMPELKIPSEPLYRGIGTIEMKVRPPDFSDFMNNVHQKVAEAVAMPKSYLSNQQIAKTATEIQNESSGKTKIPDVKIRNLVSILLLESALTLFKGKCRRKIRRKLRKLRK